MSVTLSSFKQIVVTVFLEVSLSPPLFALLHVTLPHPSEGLCVLSHFSLVRLFETPWTVLEWEGIFMSVFQRHEHRSLIRYLKPMT